MRPVIRGRHAAISSMKPEATRAAENILRAGGNAFDAAVAGQAVLALVDPFMNGIGSDAEILVYDAKTKQAYSLNAEGTAPKLATIDWYNKNNGGKLAVPAHHVSRRSFRRIAYFRKDTAGAHRQGS